MTPVWIHWCLNEEPFRNILAFYKYLKGSFSFAENSIIQCKIVMPQKKTFSCKVVECKFRNIQMMFWIVIILEFIVDIYFLFPKLIQRSMPLLVHHWSPMEFNNPVVRIVWPRIWKYLKHRSFIPCIPHSRTFCGGIFFIFRFLVSNIRLLV